MKEKTKLEAALDELLSLYLNPAPSHFSASILQDSDSAVVKKITAFSCVVRKKVWSAAGLQVEFRREEGSAQMYPAFVWASPGHNEKFARSCPNNGYGL